MWLFSWSTFFYSSCFDLLSLLKDVAYALTTTLSEDTLDQMDNLVKYYVTKLGMAAFRII